MSKIVELIRNSNGLPTEIRGIPIPTVFTVGMPAVDGGSVVTEILFYRDGFVKSSLPCYGVKFEGDEIRIIPEKYVLEVARLSSSKKEGSKEIDLPEAV